MQWRANMFEDFEGEEWYAACNKAKELVIKL